MVAKRGSPRIGPRPEYLKRFVYAQLTEKWAGIVEMLLYLAAAAHFGSAEGANTVSEEGDKGVVPSGATLKEEGTVPPMPHGAFVKEEDTPANPVVKEEGAVPPMPPDAFVKTEAVVKEEERSDGRPKRKKTK